MLGIPSAWDRKLLFSQLNSYYILTIKLVVPNQENHCSQRCGTFFQSSWPTSLGWIVKGAVSLHIDQIENNFMIYNEKQSNMIIAIWYFHFPHLELSCTILLLFYIAKSTSICFYFLAVYGASINLTCNTPLLLSLIDYVRRQLTASDGSVSSVSVYVCRFGFVEKCRVKKSRQRKLWSTHWCYWAWWTTLIAWEKSETKRGWSAYSWAAGGPRESWMCRTALQVRTTR